MENDFLERGLNGFTGPEERTGGSNGPVASARQCELLDLPRSTFYHVPQPVSEEDLELMRLIDRCHMELPFYGSRRIRGWLKDEGIRSTASGTASNAHHGCCGGLSESATSARPSSSPGLSVSAEESDDRSTESGLGGRYHVSADGQGFCLSGGDHGLAVAKGALLAAVQHDGQFLCRCAEGRDRGLRHTGDLQHRPGQPVHERGFYRCAEAPGIRSAWTARAVGWTTSLSSACGAV